MKVRIYANGIHTNDFIHKHECEPVINKLANKQLEHEN